MATLGPAFREPPICCFGPFPALSFFLPAFGQIVLVARATLAPPRWLAGSQFEIPQHFGMQGGANPGIVLAARTPVPDNDGNFSGDGNGRHMGAALCKNTFVEREERTG